VEESSPTLKTYIDLNVNKQKYEKKKDITEQEQSSIESTGGVYIRLIMKWFVPAEKLA